MSRGADAADIRRMLPGRRLFPRFDLVTLIMGFVVIGCAYALVLFLLWVAFGDSAPHVG